MVLVHVHQISGAMHTQSPVFFVNLINLCNLVLGAIQVLRNADGVGGSKFQGKGYEGVRFNVISVMRGCPISRKKALRNT